MKNPERGPRNQSASCQTALSHSEIMEHLHMGHSLDEGFLICNSKCAVVGIGIQFAVLQVKYSLVDRVTVVTHDASCLRLGLPQPYQQKHHRPRGALRRRISSRMRYQRGLAVNAEVTSSLTRELTVLAACRRVSAIMPAAEPSSRV
jgi:hypothetical protein